MGFKLFGRGDVEVQVRRSEAVHVDEGGTYHIGEVALVNTVEDEAYVTAAGIAVRKDPMNRDQRAARKDAAKAVSETK
jgi:hypothetical protein